MVVCSAMPVTMPSLGSKMRNAGAAVLGVLTLSTLARHLIGIMRLYSKPGFLGELER